MQILYSFLLLLISLLVVDERSLPPSIRDIPAHRSRRTESGRPLRRRHALWRRQRRLTLGGLQKRKGTSKGREIGGQLAEQELLAKEATHNVAR